MKQWAETPRLLRVLIVVGVILFALWLFKSCSDSEQRQRDEAMAEAYQEGYNAGVYDSYKRMKEITETEGYDPDDLARLHRLGDLTDEELAGKIREMKELYKYLMP